MWRKLFIFVWPLLAVDWTQGQRFEACLKPTFLSCQHYCKDNCRERGVDCLYHCENGCGCEAAYIVSNNGGCSKVFECELNDDASQEVREPPTPCHQKVVEQSNENGDPVLNLLEFKPPTP